MKQLFTFVLFVHLIWADDRAVQEFIKGNNLFAPAVYKELVKIEKSNFLLSALSAEIVLALLQSGCEGPTGQELRKGLYLPNNKTKIESAAKSLFSKLNTNDHYTFSTANKIYVNLIFKIKDDYKTTATDVYYAEAEDIDFSKNIEAAATINKWVEEHTNEKIKNIVKSDSLTSSTAVVLVNALYFKANWSVPFDPRDTRPNDFYRTPSEIVQVETFHLHNKRFNYYESRSLRAQFLELPFKGTNASMVLVLPFKKDGLSALENQSDKVIACHCFKKRNLHVAVPKFRIETTIDFQKILEKLGVTKIFSRSEADLSGIGGQKGDLVVDFVTQKTFINFTEGGVEAAAATVVGVVPTSVVLPPEGITNFVADHPFMFYIKVQGLFVFAGRVTDPQ